MFSIVFPSKKKYYHKHSSANFRTSSWNSIQISGIIKQKMQKSKFPVYVCRDSPILRGKTKRTGNKTKKKPFNFRWLTPTRWGSTCKFPKTTTKK